MLTASLLIKIYGCKTGQAASWLAHLDAAAKFADVDDDNNRLACFLAQLGHESGRLRYTREIWGPTAQQLRYDYGTPLARTLGNFQPGDGRRYLGRGLIQVTGRMNYQLTAARMRAMLDADCSADGTPVEVPDFEQNPELLELPFWAAMSAALFWRLRKLNNFADRHDFITLTRRINGGINGLADRQALYSLALGALV